MNRREALTATPMLIASRFLSTETKVAHYTRGKFTFCGLPLSDFKHHGTKENIPHDIAICQRCKNLDEDLS